MQIISNKKWNAVNTHIKALQSFNVQQVLNRLSTQVFPTWQSYREMEAYETMDDIYSVVSYLATTAALIPFYGYEVKDEKAYKAYRSKDLNTIQSRYFATKALDDLPDNDKLSLWLEQLSFEEKEKLYTYLLFAGEVFIYKDKLELGPNKGLIKTHFLHPNRVTLIISEGFPKEIIGYKYQDNDLSFIVPKEDIIFIKYFNPTTNYMAEWRGLSPLKVLSKRLTRLQSGMDASVAQMQNGGVPGIVFDKTPNLAIGVMGQRKDTFSRYLRNLDNKGAPYFANGDMDYIKLGLGLADLEVAELGKIDFKKICNAYKTSDILFNNDSASTESNVKEMVKRTYTNTILPNVYRVRDALNKGLVPEFADKKRYIECDISGIPELQEDMQKQAAALNTMWWINGNEKRGIQNFDKSDNQLMEEFIISSGSMLLNDLEMPDDINNGANDYTNTNDAE